MNGFSLDFLSAAEENKKSLTVLSPVRLRPVTGGSPLPLLLFFSLCLLVFSPNPKARYVLFWLVGVTPETCLVKGPSHGVLGGAVSRRKAESRQVGF